MKILMLTTIYPSPDVNLLNSTNVCHYFAKEWVKEGHEVKVIFNYPIYTPVLHKIAKIFEKKIASIGSAYVTTQRITEDERYNMDGVIIDRFPLYKFLPRIKVRKKNIDKQIDKIVKSNEKDAFVPNVITAHFYYPHIEIVSRLKQLYQAKSCVVVHKQGLKLEKYYKKNYLQLLSSVDVWGYRSAPLKVEFETRYGEQKNSFMCYSGIPENYIEKELSNKIFNQTIEKFVYVGSLISRKSPDSLIHALNKVYSSDNFTLQFIGTGIMKDSLEQISKKYNNKNVIFEGQKERAEVQNILKDSECFIMISKDETFGLVYLEAMSKGCITIASKKEGMDGIIENGVNGFLCEAGNSNELAELMRHINTLSIEQKQLISKNAKNTAFNLTDKKVALLYLDNLL